jgi:hypothetical protein
VASRPASSEQPRHTTTRCLWLSKWMFIRGSWGRLILIQPSRKLREHLKVK